MSDTVLSTEEIEKVLPELDVAWSDIPGQGLVRVFETGTFAKGMEMVAKLAKLAEDQGHYPEIHLTPEQIEVTLFSLEAGGVTSRDIELARAIDASL